MCLYCTTALQGELILISALKTDDHHGCLGLFLFPPDQFGKGLKMGSVYKSCQPYLREITKVKARKKKRIQMRLAVSHVHTDARPGAPPVCSAVAHRPQLAHAMKMKVATARARRC